MAGFDIGLEIGDEFRFRLDIIEYRPIEDSDTFYFYLEDFADNSVKLSIREDDKFSIKILDTTKNSGLPDAGCMAISVEIKISSHSYRMNYCLHYLFLHHTNWDIWETNY